MSTPRILFVMHNHPAVKPGGAEAYALEFHNALRASGRLDSVLVARNDIPASFTPGTSRDFASVNGDPGQYFLYTVGSEFNHFDGTGRRKTTVTRKFAAFLEEQQPDIVHFQHTMFLGYDMVRVVRNVLPDAPIVYTLQEYLPICHRSGQMVRTVNEELCLEESPRRCNECFPNISPQRFFLRKRFIQSHLALVDLFIAPSKFLRDRYVDWGISPDRILVEDYGRLPMEPAEVLGPPDRRKNRLGFFGQITRFKGVDVLLEAMAILATRQNDAHLRLHGANLQFQAHDFQEKVHALLEATRSNVTVVGRYDHAELARLMAAVDWVVVPSIWWENSPLVIQEAFAHRRPIICSDIGGMAEKVTDGVTGLHFRARDPHSLADTIEHAIGTPNLWDEMRAAITGPHPMDAHVARMTELYEELLARRAVEAKSA